MTETRTLAYRPYHVPECPAHQAWADLAHCTCPPGHPGHWFRTGLARAGLATPPPATTTTAWSPRLSGPPVPYRAGRAASGYRDNGRTVMPDRGAEAYREARDYMAGENPGLSRWQLRRLALTYLRLTASPPLTWKERLSAWRQAWTGGAS